MSLQVSFNYYEELLASNLGDDFINREQYSKVVEVNRITGYGLMFCLRALKQTLWDINKAVEYLIEYPPNSYSYNQYLNKVRYALIDTENGYLIYDLMADRYIIIENDIAYKRVVSIMIENNNTILKKSDINHS